MFRRRAAFQTFNDPNLIRLLDACAEFAGRLNYCEPAYWLTIIADSGAGKTHLARAMYRQFMADNRFEVQLDARYERVTGGSGQFAGWRKVCDDLRAGCYGRIDDLCEDWFLILDDIGAERDPTGFSTSCLDRILDSRRNKPTFITTNLTLAEIADRLDVRIASRLVRGDNVVIECEVMDFALRSKP